LIEPRVFGDERGFFLEIFQAQRYLDAGVVDRPFVQDNLSRSHRGVLRGLHFQIRHPQGKLVYVTRGRVWDAAVDVRPGSPTFGQWFAAELDDRDHRQMYLPPGLAHGFAVLSDTAEFIYKCTDYYHPEDEGGVAWDDPDIGLPWPVTAPLLAEKDRKFPRLKNLGPDRLPHLES
jgi:dTDP-4-dehydrorhamnose 3,5-epimerase